MVVFELSSPRKSVFTISVRGPLCAQSHGGKAQARSRSGAAARICLRCRQGFAGTIRPHTEIVNRF